MQLQMFPQKANEVQTVDSSGGVSLRFATYASNSSITATSVGGDSNSCEIFGHSFVALAEASCKPAIVQLSSFCQSLTN